MKKRTLLMLIVSILCLLGASTLVYNALTPEDTNYKAQSDGSVQENTSLTAFSVESDSTETLLSESLPVSESESAVLNGGLTSQTTVPAPSAKTTTAAPPAQTTAAATTAPPQIQAAPRAAQTTTAAPKSGNAADFTVYDAAGNEVHLSDYRGRAVIMNFWASWCGPCKAEMPLFQSAYNQYSGDAVFLMINLTDGKRETKESAQSFLSTNGYTFPTMFDTKRSASTAYGISSIPSTYFISKEGNIQSKHIGQINASQLESGIRSIL